MHRDIPDTIGGASEATINTSNGGRPRPRYPWSWVSLWSRIRSASAITSAVTGTTSPSTAGPLTGRSAAVDREWDPPGQHRHVGSAGTSGRRRGVMPDLQWRAVLTALTVLRSLRFRTGPGEGAERRDGTASALTSEQ